MFLPTASYLADRRSSDLTLLHQLPAPSLLQLPAPIDWLRDCAGFPLAMSLAIDVYHKGCFVPNPFYYGNPDIESVTGVEVSNMEFKEFMTYLRSLIRNKCRDVYYCLQNRALVDGLRELRDEDDYVRFMDAGFSNDCKINIYIDDYHEPVLEWIDEEKADEGDIDSETCDDDVDSVMSDDVSLDLEADEEDIQWPKSVDPFLSNKNLIPDEVVEEDEVVSKVHKIPIHDPDQKWDTMKPVLGMRFSDRNELKHMLTNYAVVNGYALWYEMNESSRLLVRCSKTEVGKPSCPFRLWATPMSMEDSFQIKSLVDDHNCCRQQNLGALVTYKWIGKMLLNDILERPRFSYRKMKEEVRKRFGLKVSVGQCRNAKYFGQDEISGSLASHYEKLWSYGAELLRTNPGSSILIGTNQLPDQTTYFKRMYICLKGVKDGWIEGCRRVIGIDGCFLKGICRGELLSAVGRDANNQMYPLAWAVVAVENKETWKWFLDNLLEDIKMGDGTGLTIISDQHKGLVEAVKERAPSCEHRQCARHIFANFKKKGFTGVEHRRLFWRAAKATTEPSFSSYMREICAMSVEAYDHLIERDPNTWCRAFFEPERCCDAVENGISESFNASIVEARKKPIITMLEEIRVYVMERMYNQKVKGNKWDLEICPSIRKKIETMKEQQRYWDVIPSGDQQYEVKFSHEVYAVHLEHHTCGCRSWQLTGIPCVHAVAAILFLNDNPEDYVAVWYTTSMFGSCYRYPIKPINGPDMWPTVDCNPILPPRRRRMPGRPKVNRRKCPTEKVGKHSVTKKGTSIPRCGICHQEGHNKRRCPLLNQANAHVDEEPVAVGNEEPEAVADDANDHVYEEQVYDEHMVTTNGSGGFVANKRRLPSQRITKLKLKKRVATKDGSGESHENPLNL
ncbi:hypothetical protein LXL04_012271 [Taraxacum kok-saghyz]